MASKVLKSFLIGIGYDTKVLEAGDKKISASLGNIKSGALGVSASLVGAFGFAASAVAGVSDRVDKLAMSTQNLRTSMNTVYSFGSAVKLMGGEASEALDTIKGFEEIQNNLRLKGDAGPIGDMAMAGLDVSSLYATNTGEEFLRALAEMIPKLDEGQRAVAQNALGLSDGVFRSLAGGVEQLDATMKRASSLTGSVDQLTGDARKLAENASEFGLIVEGIKNEMAEKFLPSLVGAGDALNDFLKESRGKISNVIDYSAENPEATAALGLSSITAMTGAVLAKLGLSTIGGAISKAGTAGLAVTGGAVGANVLNKELDERVPGYSEASKSFDEFLKSITGLDRIKSPIEVLFGKPISKREENPIEEKKPKTEESSTKPAPIKQEQSLPEKERVGIDDQAQAKQVEPKKIDKSFDLLDIGARGLSRQAEHEDNSTALPPAARVEDMSLDGRVKTIEQKPARLDQTRDAEAWTVIPELRTIFGDRSAADAAALPPSEAYGSGAAKEVQSQNLDDMVRAIQAAKLSVNNNQSFTIQLDGQALETKITQVNERLNYETLGDLQTTTER